MISRGGIGFLIWSVLKHQLQRFDKAYLNKMLEVIEIMKAEARGLSDRKAQKKLKLLTKIEAEARQV